VLAGALADVDAFGRRRCLGQQSRVGQGVEHHNIGLAQHLQAAHRDQTRVSRPGPHQVHQPHFFLHLVTHRGKP